MLYRKKALLAKIESTYGVDANPTGAANAILTKGLSIQTLQGATVNRDIDREMLGNDITYHTGIFTKLSFDVEISGSGAAGTAPGYGPLLRACGFSETIDLTMGLEKVIYDPVSSGFESATLYYNLDGELHKLLGARGTVKLGLNKEQIPVLSFEFTGLRVAAAASALPAGDVSGFTKPIAVNKANSTFTLHGYAAVLESLSLDIANDVVYRNLVNSESVLISDRAPSGNCTIDKPTLAAKDYEAIMAAHTTGALQFVHGATSGNIVEIDAPAVQLLQPNIGESNGIATLGMNLSLIPNAGDDELKITVK